MKKNEEYLKNYEQKKRALPWFLVGLFCVFIVLGYVFSVVPLDYMGWFMFWLLFANVVYAVWLRLSGRWPSR